MAAKLRVLSMKKHTTASTSIVVIPITTIISLSTNPLWRVEFRSSIYIRLEPVACDKGRVGSAARHFTGRPIHSDDHLPHVRAVPVRERNISNSRRNDILDPAVRAEPGRIIVIRQPRPDKIGRDLVPIKEANRF